MILKPFNRAGKITRIRKSTGQGEPSCRISIPRTRSRRKERTDPWSCSLTSYVPQHGQSPTSYRHSHHIQTPTHTSYRHPHHTNTYTCHPDTPYIIQIPTHTSHTDCTHIHIKYHTQMSYILPHTTHYIQIFPHNTYIYTHVIHYIDTPPYH